MRVAASRPVLLLVLFLSAWSGTALGQSADSRMIADLEARILRLEEEVRQLRGRAEEAEYQARAAAERMDRLVADIDARLRGVEPGPDVAAPDAGVAVQPAPQPGPQVAAPSPSEPGVLGTLPDDTLAGLPAPPPEPPAPDGTAAVAGSPRDRFDAGMARVKAGDWSGAEAAFASMVSSAPDDPLAPNAAYWQAETYYARQQWPQAAASFARNVSTYGDDAVRAPDNVLKLGMSLARMGDRQKACATFAEFDRRYPKAPVALKQMASREKSNAGCA